MALTGCHCCLMPQPKNIAHQMHFRDNLGLSVHVKVNCESQLWEPDKVRFRFYSSAPHSKYLVSGQLVPCVDGLLQELEQHAPLTLCRRSYDHCHRS